MYWTNKRKGTTIILAIVLIICAIFGSKVVETVEKGTYHVKQAAFTGEMSVIMEPGMYAQNFGDITVWPRAETFYFTDKEEGGAGDARIHVQFNDGSTADISGSLRVTMPVDPDKALALVTEANFKTYDQLEHELVLKITRNALMLTANLMSARESYAEKRPDFVFWAWDQIEHGLYETEEKMIDEVDIISKEKIQKAYKVIKRGPDGKPVRQKSQLEGLSITLSNFEIKDYGYDPKVQAQIAEQQTAFMAVATARAKAAQAQQENVTAEAEGQAKVTKAKYEEMEKKARAVVQAEQDKEVAETKAKQEKEVAAIQKEREEIEATKRLEVAKLDRQAAEETKLKDIALGEGEAKRKQLVMAADGALEKKLEAWTKVNELYARALADYRGHWVPQIVMGSQGSGNGTAAGAQDLIQLLMAKTAKDLALDLSVMGSPSPTPEK